MSMGSAYLTQKTQQKQGFPTAKGKETLVAQGNPQPDLGLLATKPLSGKGFVA
jgi:hypothetical protein